MRPMSTPRSAAPLLGLALLALACGGDPPIVPPDDGPKPLIPLAVGHRWTYRVTSSSGVASSKIQTVTGTRAVGALTGYRVETSRDQDQGTHSVQVIEDGVLERVSEETIDAGVVKSRYLFEPFGVRIDSRRTTAGDAYQDRHEKRKVDDGGAVLETEVKVHDFTVEAARELVDVPAGTFECVRVKRTEGDGSFKVYWYAPGIGKVKEVGGQTEELSRVELAN